MTVPRPPSDGDLGGGPVAQLRITRTGRRALAVGDGLSEDEVAILAAFACLEDASACVEGAHGRSARRGLEVACQFTSGLAEGVAYALGCIYREDVMRLMEVWSRVAPRLRRLGWMPVILLVIAVTLLLMGGVEALAQAVAFAAICVGAYGVLVAARRKWGRG
jgi:hypothetical protein